MRRSAADPYLTGGSGTESAITALRQYDKVSTMTEYINKEYYKSLPVSDRYYLSPGSNVKAFMDRLNDVGIQFSATIGDYKQTVTVSKAYAQRAGEILSSLTAEMNGKTALNRNIIGNTAYKDIADKRYIRTDIDTARAAADILENRGIRFSGLVREKNATITVSGDENAAAVRSVIENMKYGALIEELRRAGFERVPDTDGFINLHNVKTGNVTGFDGFEMIRSMWEDPENEFFHPSVYKIVRDEEKHDYYISERYSDRDEERDVYYEKNGNVPTFGKIDDAVRYVRDNNISVINTASELDELRADEVSRREREREENNTKLIAQFPHDNDMYPDDVVYYPENGRYDWYYFNPDGDDGRGVFNYSRLTDDDIYNAYQAYKAETEIEKGHTAFFSYLYNYANAEIIDTRREEFATYARDYIRKPSMTERYYGLLENGGNEVEIERFIHTNELRNKLIQADYDRNYGVFTEDIDLRTATAEQRQSYRRSMESNIRCAEAISDAVHNYYGFKNENSLDTETALSDLINRFTSERIGYVLAVVINARAGSDKRISGTNFEWAKDILKNIPALYTSQSNRSVMSIRSQLGETHTGLINLLVDEFKGQYPELSLNSEKEVFENIEESISDRVSREYKEYLENIRRQSVDVIIQSANEIAEKEKIKLYFEEYFDENSFREKYLAVLRNATHLLEDVYSVWSDMPNLSSVEDVREAITAGIEYGKIRFVMPEKEDVQQYIPQISLAEQVEKHLQDELAEFNAEMLALDPSNILSRITEISTKRKIADVEVEELSLSDEQLSALLTSKNILDEVYREWLSLDTNGLEDIGLAFEECADAIMESLKREQTETISYEPETIPDEPVHDKQYYFEQAQKYINDFCDAEYDQTADFSNINEVGIAYTTITDEEIPLQINADLENYQIKYYLDNRLYKTEDYDSLQEMVEDALSVLDFNELIYTVEQDPDERIQAFVDVDTHISVPEQGISFDIKAVDEFVMEGTYSEYLGGMDENGHEAKDNFQQYDTSLSLRLEGAKVISEVYDERNTFSPYGEDIFDFLEDGDREKLYEHIARFDEDNDINKVYTVKNGTKTPLDLKVPEDDVIKTEPPFGIKNDHLSVISAAPGSFNDILRGGSLDDHSLENIVSYFMNGKSDAENSEFLAKQFGTGGRGYIIGEERVAAWFGKEGITFAAGDTAFPIGVNSFVPWEDAAARIRTLLEKGEYVSQDIIDAAPDYNRQQIAEDIWYLHQDLEEGVEFFLPDEYFYGGFPDNTARIAEELKDPTFIERVEQGLSDFAERYRQDSDILRFSFHKPDELLSRVRDLTGEHKSYKTAPGFKFEPHFFITEDEKDQIMMNGGGVADSKYRINRFFSEKHNEKEKIDFLRSEYGTGGMNRTGFSEWHDAKGISVQKKGEIGDLAKYDFKWNEVSKRISRLVEDGIYFTEKDAADHERHLEWQRENQSESPYKPAFTPTFDIYQVKQGAEYRNVRYLSYDELSQLGETLDRSNYEKVYTGRQSMIDRDNKLEGIYEYFNLNDLPDDYAGHSPTMGDVIILHNEDGDKAYYADRSGFVDVTEKFLGIEEKVEKQEVNATAEKTEAVTKNEGITIDGQDSTWSVINTMTYGGKELSLLENDELGEDVPYIIMDSDNKVLSDRAHSLEDLTSVYTESEVALGLVPDKTIVFTVAEFDDGTETAIYDGRLNMDDIQKTNEYLDYADTTEYDDIRLHLEQYIIGAGDPSDLSNEQAEYIKANVPAVKRDASLLESDSETIQHEYYSDIVKDMGLQHSNITFAVVKFDDEKTVIMDSSFEEDDIYDSDEFHDYVESTGKTRVEVSYEYFCLGADVESEYTSARQKEYILENLEDVTAEATSLQGGVYTAHVAERDYEFDEYDNDEQEPVIEDALDDNSDIIEETEEQAEEPEKERLSITVAELSVGDMFRYKGSVYTIEEMNGIYPDDVAISKTESLGGRDYIVKQNIDRFRLVREGEYLGNPEKVIERQEAYTPHIGDIIEIDGTNLYEIEDISGDEVTFREIDTLIPDTLKMPLSDLYTHDFEVVNENEYYKKQDDYVPEDDTVSIDEATEDEVSSDDLSADIPEKDEENAPKARNYVITDDNIGVATPKVRYADNIAAITTLKEIEIQGRTATPDEQQILAKYIGWGAIPQVFDGSNDKWTDEYAELKGILTDEEYSAARKSTMNAHYTSPTVINAIYKGLENMGFKVGKILEPAVGTGNFFGRLPGNMGASHLTGVELDSITGRIAKQLYPSADIRIQGFEETAFADNTFDIAIGNVPFGDYKLHDRKYDDNNFLIHDYFFTKALDKVRPGGIVAFVTSKGTLDKENSKVREYIAQRAELLGAIRLPNTAFKANAGTEVTSDIIFLKKREFPIEISLEQAPWIGRSEGNDGIVVNNYFVDHPDMILGTMTEGGGQFGKETQCVPFAGADLKEQLEKAVTNIHGEYKPYTRAKTEEVQETVPAPLGARKFSFYAVKGQLYYLADSDTMTRFKAKGDIEKRALGMIGIRDTLRELLDLQLNNADGTLDGEIAEKRKELNDVYDSFVAKYGHVNDVKNAKAFKGDDGYYLVAGLEQKNEKGEISGKADIFTKNTVKPKIITSHVDSAQEALILSVSEKAKVDFTYMTELTGMDKDKLISELQGQIFRLPKEEEEYVTADEYLTGKSARKYRHWISLPQAWTYPSTEKLSKQQCRRELKRRI